MRRGLILLVLAGVATGFAACWFAGSYLIGPSPGAVGAPPTDLPAETVSWETPDGRRINGWFVPGQVGQGAIVLLHRLRGSRRSMLDRARFLNRAGYTVLLFDFQAHGETEGSFMTFGMLESGDAESALDYLKRRLPEEKTGVIGVSLGGAAALLSDIATRL